MGLDSTFLLFPGIRTFGGLRLGLTLSVYMAPNIPGRIWVLSNLSGAPYTAHGNHVRPVMDCLNIHIEIILKTLSRVSKIQRVYNLYNLEHSLKMQIRCLSYYVNYSWTYALRHSSAYHPRSGCPLIAFLFYVYMKSLLWSRITYSFIIIWFLWT